MTDPHSETGQQGQHKPKRRWRRRVLLAAAALTAGAIGLILLAPTLLGTAPGRAVLKSIIDRQLNGSLKIDEASFGWLTGQKLGGIKVYDEQKSLVAEINRVETDLTLLAALRGRFDLGTTLVDVNLTRLQVDRDGHTNLEKLLKPHPPKAEPSKPDSVVGAPSPLPDVRGNLTVRYRGSIEYVDRVGGSALSPPLVIEPGEAKFAIENINQPVNLSAGVSLRVGERAAGKLELAGTIDAIEGNRINLDALRGEPRVRLTGIDLSAIAPILRLLGVDGELGGMVSGTVALSADGLKNAGLEADVTIMEAAASFPQLVGDSLRFARVDVPIRIRRTVLDDRTTRLKIESLKVEAPGLQLVAAGELTEESIGNLLSGRPPGSQGWLSATVDARDLPGIVNQLRQTARLQPDVKLTAGRAVQQLELTLEPEKSFAKLRVDVQASGQRAGRGIAIKPVHVSLDATYLPNATLMNGLRDVAMVVTSSFATAKGGGRTLDQLDFAGDFDLSGLKAEVEQFVDMGGLKLAGRGSYSIGTRGDFSKPGSDLAASVAATLDGVDVVLPGRPRIAIGHLQLSGQANLATDERGAVSRIRSAGVNAVSGESSADKVLELVAAASDVDLSTGSVQRFELSNLSISDLAKLQGQFGAFVTALNDHQIAIRSGQAYAKIVGSFDGNARKLRLDSADLSTPNLTVARGGAPLLTREKFVVSAAGNVTLGDSILLDFSKLSLSSNLLSVNKGEAGLSARIDPGGAVTGSGRLTLSADLPRIAELAQGLGGGAPPARVTGGKFDGTIDLSGGIGRESTLKLDGTIAALNVASPGGGGMENETVAIKVTATTDANLATAKATARVDSAFAKVEVPQAELKLTGGAYDLVQSGRVLVGVPDLPKLYALASAFAGAPALPRGSGAAAGDAGQPVAVPDPIVLTSGGASAAIDAARSGTVLKLNVTDCRVSKLALARGDKKFAFDRQTPISLLLAADVDAAGDRFGGLKVTKLAGDLRVAAVELTKPIEVTFAGEEPAASGSIKVTGDLSQARGLLELLGITPAGTELAGALSLTAGASTRGDVVSMTLAGTIDQFRLRAPDQKPVQQKQVTIDGLARLDTKSQQLAVEKLALKLPDNDALAIDLTGGMVSLPDLLVRLDNTRLQYSYDLEQLWPMVLPFLDPATQETLADTQVKGKLSRTIAFKGNYAAGKPFHEAIAGVSGDGAFDVEFFESQGVTVNALSIPFKIDRGVLRITEAKPAAANNGTLNLAGLVVDLTAPVPRLSGPKKHRVLHNCSINPALGDSLGKYINPIFPNSERAKGILDVTIDSLDQVALGPELFTADSGRARIVFSITDMDIANPLGSIMFGPIIGKLNPGWASGQADVFKGEIRDAVITLEKGRTTQDVTIRLTEDIRAKDPVTGQTVTVPRQMPMTFQGDIRLSDLRQSLKVTVPPALLGKLINVSEKDMNNWFPGGVPITLGGTTLRPTADVGNIIQRLIEGRIRSGLIGGSGDPLGELLRGIGGGGRDDRPPDGDRRRRDDPPPRDDRPR